MAIGLLTQIIDYYTCCHARTRSEDRGPGRSVNAAASCGQQQPCRLPHGIIIIPHVLICSNYSFKMSLKYHACIEIFLFRSASRLRNKRAFFRCIALGEFLHASLAHHRKSCSSSVLPRPACRGSPISHPISPPPPARVNG